MKLVLTPDWFLNADVLIEGFSFIVLFLFFLLCVKYYKLNKKKNFLYLGIGFFLIALAQLAVIFTKLVLYYDTTFTQQVGTLIVSYKLVKSIDIFYYAGFFFHRFLTLLGFYIIYRLPLKKQGREDLILTFYFLIISAIFSTNMQYLYHLTILVLLALIINNYYEIYKKNKNINTKILIAALCILSLSHVIFLLSKLEKIFVVANIIQLLGYITLLLLIVKILYIKSK